MIVQYAHENPSLRWSTHMCLACAKDAFERKGTGEFIFLPLENSKQDKDEKNE